MSPLDRRLAGDTLLFDLDDEAARALEVAGAGGSGRTGRTLLKEGPLRVSLVALEPGGAIAEHGAPGPVTIQPLSGSIHVGVDGSEHPVGARQLFSLGGGVRHSVRSESGAVFLLTVVQVASAS